MLLPDLSVLGPEDGRDASGGADPRSLLEGDETLVVLAAANRQLQIAWYHREGEGTHTIAVTELERDPGAALALVDYLAERPRDTHWALSWLAQHLESDLVAQIQRF